MATSQRIDNFSSLIVNNIYKITNVETYVTDFTPNQVVYTLNDGQRLFGRNGIDDLFKSCTVPFYFQFKGQSNNELFKRYKFNVYKNAEELVFQNHNEIVDIMVNYISDKICEGCTKRQSNQETHMCMLETRIEQAKQYLTIALDEHPKYDVGDIVDAFVDFRTLLLP